MPKHCCKLDAMLMVRAKIARILVKAESAKEMKCSCRNGFLINKDKQYI
jgi:hypothetical protein